MCSGPLARVVAFGLHRQHYLSRALRPRRQLSSPSVAKSTRTVNIELDSAMDVEPRRRLTLHDVLGDVRLSAAVGELGGCARGRRRPRSRYVVRVMMRWPPPAGGPASPLGRWMGPRSAQRRLMSANANESACWSLQSRVVAPPGRWPGQRLDRRQIRSTKHDPHNTSPVSAAHPSPGLLARSNTVDGRWIASLKQHKSG